MIDGIFERIRAELARQHSSLEQHRLERDLERVAVRLEQREYAKASFDDNVVDMPGRLDQLFVELDFYHAMGNAIADVLRPLPLPQAVADVCPGYAPKVELALRQLGYGGEVVLIDKDAQSFAKVRAFLNLFEPRFKVRDCCADVLRDDVGRYDLVVACHAIDDFIIDTLSDDAPAVYASEKRLRELWSNVLASPADVHRALVPKISDLFRRLTTAQGTVVVIQYPSYTERLLNLLGANDFCVDLLHQVGEATLGEFEVHQSAELNSPLIASDHCFIFQRS